MIDDKSKQASHPNIYASTEYKDSDKFGQEIGRYIKSKWLDNSRYDERKRDIALEKSYRDGNPIDKKKILGYVVKNLEASSLNLDTDLPNILSRYVTLINSSVDDSLYKVNGKAIDKTSVDKRNKYVTDLEQKYYGKDYLQKMGQVTGVDYLGEDTPTSKEDLELRLSLKGKEPQELAIETMTEGVLYMNAYREGISRKIKDDFIAHSQAVIMNETDSSGRVNIEYVPLEDFVHSDSIGHYDDFRDMYYAGQIKLMTIQEFARRTKITDVTKLQKIAVANSGANENPVYRDEYKYDDYKDFVIRTIMYDFQTFVIEKYKKKSNKHGGYKLIPKESTWNLDGIDSKSEVIESNYKVWYEGLYLPSTGEVFNHKRQANHIRYKNSLAEPIGKYIYYKIPYQSLVRNAMPFLRNMWIVWLKTQHVLSRIVPDGFVFDEAALANMTGKTPNQIMDEFWEEGSIVANLDGNEGEGNRVPIIPLRQEVYSKIQALNMAWMNNLQNLKLSMGVTDGLEGKTTSESLVGVQKLSIMSGNASISFLKEANLNIFRRLANSLVLRIQDAVSTKNGDLLYSNAFGEVTVDMMQSMKTIHQHDFSILVDVLPDLEQKAEFNQTLSSALQGGMINMEDYLTIKEYSDNLTLSRKYLRVKVKTRADEQAKMQQATMQSQSEAQNAQAQAKIQSEMQMYQMKKQADIQYEQQLHDLKMEELRQEYLLKTASEIDINEFKLTGQKELDVINGQVKQGVEANVQAKGLEQQAQQLQQPQQQ